MKKYLSQIRRAVSGWWSMKTEKIPEIDKNIKRFVIGKTVENQDIYYYEIGKGSNKILMLSAIHGNEAGTVKLAHFLIDWYQKQSYPELTVYLIPCLNIDGYNKARRNPDYLKGGRIGRFNGHNVDLNRNFLVPSFTRTASWTHGKNYENKTEVFSGEFGNSEPETQALTKFIKDNKIKFVFSFHNAGADVVGNTVGSAEVLAKKFSRICNYKFISAEEWKKFNQTGSSYEWCTQNDIGLLEIEATSRWGSDWARLKPAIESTLNEIAKGENF